MEMQNHRIRAGITRRVNQIHRAYVLNNALPSDIVLWLSESVYGCQWGGFHTQLQRLCNRIPHTR